MTESASGELGVVCAPQHPERWVRTDPEGTGAGLVPAAEIALALAGSVATAHAASSVTIVGRAGVVPPGVTVTLHASPSRLAVTVAIPAS